MKNNELKHLVREIITEAIMGLRELHEAVAKDPTKEEMEEYLWQHFGRHADGQKDFEFNAAEAIYWFANHYHGGQWSNLYSVLSTSAFEPGRMQNGPEKGGMGEDMYHALIQKWGHEKPVDEDGGGGGGGGAGGGAGAGAGGAGGASAGVSVGNTTAAVQGYNTPNAFSRKRRKKYEEDIDVPLDDPNKKGRPLSPSGIHHDTPVAGLKRVHLSSQQKQEFQDVLRVTIDQFQAEKDESKRHEIMCSIRVLKSFLGL